MPFKPSPQPTKRVKTTPKATSSSVPTTQFAPRLTCWETLQSTIAQPQPIGRTGGAEHYKTYYGCGFPELVHLVPSVRQDVENHGYDWTTINAFGLSFMTGYESEETPYRNLFLTSSGLIVADESFRHNDENEVKNQPPWSRITYYTWNVARLFEDR
ncbi:MAG: hypothetical protein Q9201_001422 [Fulgogasparrea decipioides]